MLCSSAGVFSELSTVHSGSFLLELQHSRTLWVSSKLVDLKEGSLSGCSTFFGGGSIISLVISFGAHGRCPGLSTVFGGYQRMMMSSKMLESDGLAVGFISGGDSASSVVLS